MASNEKVSINNHNYPLNPIIQLLFLLYLLQSCTSSQIKKPWWDSVADILDNNNSSNSKPMLKIPAYGEPCNSTLVCSKRSHLICIEGLCTCAKPNMIHDPYMFPSCLVKAGEKCRYKTQARNNIQISMQPIDTKEIENQAEFEYFTCNSNTHCVEGVCKCDRSHFEQNGTCLPCPENSIYDDSETEKKCKFKFGAKCSMTKECAWPLKCIDFACSCKYSNHQLYDPEENRCLSIVSAPCQFHQDCVPHAVCADDSSGKFKNYACHCNNGFVQVPPGFCFRGNGTLCTVNQAWNRMQKPGRKKNYAVHLTSPLAQLLVDSTFEEDGVKLIQLDDKCDKSRKLKCRDGYCTCEPMMEIYSEDKETCVGLNGALCRLDDENYCAGKLNCIARPLKQWKILNNYGRCVG